MPSLEPPLVGEYKEHTQCRECREVYPYWYLSSRSCCPRCGSRVLKTVIAREICVRKHIGFLIWRNVHSHYEVRQ